MTNRDGSAQWRKIPIYQNLFLGNYYFYHNFGNKANNCKVNTRINYLGNGTSYKAPKKNPTSNTNIIFQKSIKKNVNPFAPLMNSDIECFKCHNFGYKSYECRIRLEPLEPNRNVQP